MSESASGLSDEVVAEVSPEPEAEAEHLPQLIVVPTEHAWTAQSQHGVLLDHFVPTQDYQNNPGIRGEFSEDGW